MTLVTPRSDQPPAPPVLADMAASGGQPHEMTGGQLEQLRNQLGASLYLFAHYIMEFDQLEPTYHGAFCNYIEAWGRTGMRRLMLQSPRDSLKSSLGTIANSLWQIAREPDQPLAIFNETENNTTNWLRAIRGTVERSALFHALYGHLLPRGVAYNDKRSKSQSLRWNDTALDFEGRRHSDPEPSISGFGVGGASTGHHWPKILFDDLIGPKHRDSAAEMERVRQWLKTHLALMRPAAGGRILCSCTPWTFDDVYVDLTQKYGYVLFRRAALENEAGQADLNGEPVLRRYQKSELLAAAERDFAEFSSQMMCRPLPAGELSLDAGALRWYQIIDDTIHIEPQFVRPGEPPRVHLSRLRKALILDPAPTEPSEVKAAPRSRNAVIVLGVDSYGRKFVLQTVARRSALPDTCDLLFQLAHKWDADLLLVEEVNFSVSYRHWVLLMQQPGQKWAGVSLTPRPVDPQRKDKIKRILDMAPGFRRGDYYFNRTGCTDLHNEFLMFHPGASEIDCLDALAYNHYVHPPVDGEVLARQRREQLRYESEADPHTGY